MTDLPGLRAALAPHLFWIKAGLLVALGVSLFAAGWWVNGWRWEAKESAQLRDVQAQYEKDRERFLLDRAKWESSSQVDSAKIEMLDQQKDTLLATLNSLKLTRTVTVKTDAQGNCVADVLAPDFRLRWTEVVTTAAAHAAADSGD